jgi:cation transporter-like permease
MSANSFTDSSDASIQERPGAFDTIVFGGLIVGILDGLFAFVFYGLILGVKPLRIFQSVASGLLGRASYDGGLPTFLFGLLLHFVVATCIAAVFYAASLKLPVLIRHAVVSGLIYGLIAYLVMNYVVIPLSRIGLRPTSLRVFLPAFIAHAFLVGLPIALVARRSAKARPRD